MRMQTYAHLCTYSQEQAQAHKFNMAFCYKCRTHTHTLRPVTHRWPLCSSNEALCVAFTLDHWANNTKAAAENRPPSPAPFFSYPLTVSLLSSSFFSPLTPTFPSPDKESARTAWLEREKEGKKVRKKRARKRMSVLERKKDGEKREQLCSCQRTTRVSDINLNMLFKAFLHHRPWFISGSFPLNLFE